MKNIGELLKQYLSEGVTFKKLDSLFESFSGMTGVSNKWKETGNCVFIDYLNVYNNINVDIHKLHNATVKSFQQNTLKKGDILLTSASETPMECAISSVIRDNIADNVFLDDHLFAIRLKEEFEGVIDTAFVNYYMHSSTFRVEVCKKVRGVTRFYITGKPFMSLEIPVPPLEVQNKIVEILDNFTSLTAELEAELEARKRQYEYYRNLLLTFNPVANGAVTGGEQQIGDGFTPPIKSLNIRYLSLGEMGTFIRGGGLQKSDFTTDGFPCIHYGQIHTFYKTYAYETISYTSNELAAKLKHAKYGDLIIATTSEDVDGCCKAVAWLGGNEVAISGDSYIFRHNQNPKYISYLFQTDMFLKYKRMAATGTKVTRVSGDSMKKFVFPIPPLDEQERIVAILDSFETLVNDLTAGLPAEIEARRKQYEYYRNKLLTFKKIA